MLVNKFDKILKLRLPESVFDQLTALSLNRRISLSQLVRGILTDYLVADQEMRKINLILAELKIREDKSNDIPTDSNDQL